jgi:copper transport protein
VRAVRASAVGLICLLVLPAVASAHALLISSSPSPGAGLGAAPTAITATFSEPLNRALSTLKLTARGRTVPATVTGDGSTRLVLRPVHRLARGVYEVRWRTVSADDGHTAQGSYSFGVQASVLGPAVSAAPGPLADGGWLRALLDAIFYGALILFCGGVFCGALLSRPGSVAAAWLLPDASWSEVARRQWRLTIAIGGAAVLFSLAATLADAAHAGGGIGGRALNDYLFSDFAGYARLAVPAMLLVSVLGAVRGAARWASAPAVLALAAVADGGHSSSARLSGIAFAADLVHLIAASVWLGGIAVIAIAWVPRLRELGAVGRRRIVEVVLPRFGVVALPAFFVLVIAGGLNAVTELGSPQALWSTGYGRVLLVKTSLVGVVALLSYRHALLLRPRLLAAQEVDTSLERRHWRLLASEPFVSAGIVLAAALLLAYAPPIDAAEQVAATGSISAATVLETSAEGSQLSVAGEAGPYIVNALVSRAGPGASVELHTMDALQHPVSLPVRVPGSVSGGPCGVGCTRLAVPGTSRALAVEVEAPGRIYRVSLPIRYQPGGDAVARRLLALVENGQGNLRSVAIRETLGSGVGAPEVTSYQVGMPDRFAYLLSRNGRLVSDTTIVGTHEWTRAAGQKRWQPSVYGGGGPAFSAAGYLGWWTPFAGQPQLLDRFRAGGDERADVATASRISGLGTVWLQIAIDVTHRRVLHIGMITTAHFMTQAWTSFNAGRPIEPPPADLVAGGG